MNEIRCKEIKRGKSPTYITNSNIFVFAQKCNSKFNGIDLSLCKCLDPAKFRNYDRSEVMLPGDIIINSTGTGTLGRIGYFSKSDNINNLTLVPDSHVTVVRLSNELNSYFMKVTVDLYHKYFEKHGEGSTNQKELKPLTIQTILVPIPPRNEQDHIVNKLKELNLLIEKYKLVEEKLYELNSNIKNQLKKSILQYAIEGKLASQDPNDEPASVLLDRIRKEKQNLIAEGKIKKDKNESIIYRRDNSYYEKLDKSEKCINNQIPFKIPYNWMWNRWGNISFKIQYGYNARAKVKGKIKMVRISDIQDNKVIWENVPFCDIDDNEIEYYILHINDILFARTDGTVGKSFLVDNIEENAVFAGYLIRTVYDYINLNPKYLKYYMESNLYWSQLRKGTIATAQPNCNGQTLSSMFIPIPPLEEQKRIIEKINEITNLLEL